MLASKVICDDTYSNKSWSIVAQGMFQLREINQMEREICQYLEWELNVGPATLKEFEEMVRKDFAGIGSYPTYILPSTKKSTPPPSAIPFHPTCGISPSPLNEQRYTSLPKVPYVPSPPYASPPETLSPSYPTSSPASSASPLTIEDLSAKIVLASFIARLPEAARARPAASKQKQNVRIRIALCVVVHVHSFASRLRSLLDERSTYRIHRRHRVHVKYNRRNVKCGNQLRLISTSSSSASSSSEEN